MPDALANAYIHAPREAVFEYVSDHRRFLSGNGLARVRITRAGYSEADGLGCIREVRSKGLRFVEEVTLFERPARLDYQIIDSTLPIEHRGGSMQFIERGEGTEIDWVTRFSLPSPLPFLAAPVEELVRTLLSDAFAQLLRLAKDAIEREHRPSGL